MFRNCSSGGSIVLVVVVNEVRTVCASSEVSIQVDNLLDVAEKTSESAAMTSPVAKVCNSPKIAGR